MEILLEAHLKVLTVISLLGNLEIFIQISLQVGGGVSTRDKHVRNTVRHLLPEVLGDKFDLLLQLICDLL